MPNAKGKNLAYGPSWSSVCGRSRSVCRRVDKTSGSPLPTVINPQAIAASATTSELDFLSDSTGKSNDTTSWRLVPAYANPKPVKAYKTQNHNLK